MALSEPGPPSSNVVRSRGKPRSVISSKPVMPVDALVGTMGIGRFSSCFLQSAIINSGTVMAAGNTSGYWLIFAQRIAADAEPRGARPLEDRRISLDRDLDPIDTSVGYIRHHDRKGQNLDCSQAFGAPCRNMEWSWRQIMRQASSREVRRKTGSVREMSLVSLIFLVSASVARRLLLKRMDFSSKQGEKPQQY